MYCFHQEYPLFGLESITTIKIKTLHGRIRHKLIIINGKTTNLTPIKDIVYIEIFEENGKLDFVTIICHLYVKRIHLICINVQIVLF